MNGRAGEPEDIMNTCYMRRHLADIAVVVGDNESEIMNLIRSLPKETDKV